MALRLSTRAWASGAALLTFATSPVLAQDGAQQAGVAAAVRGNVLLAAATPGTETQRGGQVVGENIASGDKIFLGDMIETGPSSGLQSMLLDETIFTIGPSAAMTIDSFVYDPASGAGEVTTQVLKGAFRFVSGKVAKNEPSKMNVKTPVGTIGIRGTSAAGVITPIDPNTPGGPVTGTFVLLGPGAGNNAGERAGRILISNGGTTVEISRSGFGTVVASPTLPPGTPVRVDPAVVAQLTGSLGTDGSARPQENNQNGNGQGGGQSGGGGTGGQGGGQNGGQQGGTQQTGGGATGGGTTGGAVGGSTQTFTQNSGQTIGTASGAALTQFGTQTVQQQANQTQNEASEQAQTTQNFADGITSLADLNALNTGVFTFPAQTVAMSGTGVATYTINYSIDFGNRQTTGNIQVSTGAGFLGGIGNFPLITNLFDVVGGDAIASESGQIVSGNVVSGSIPGANVSGANTIQVDYSLENSGGDLAKILNHGVIYDEDAETFAAGSGQSTR